MFMCDLLLTMIGLAVGNGGAADVDDGGASGVVIRSCYYYCCWLISTVFNEYRPRIVTLPMTLFQLAACLPEENCTRFGVSSLSIVESQTYGKSWPCASQCVFSSKPHPMCGHICFHNTIVSKCQQSLLTNYD